MEKTIYKFVLSINFNKEINLIEELEEIIQAAHEFNEENDCRKCLFLCDIGKEKLELLILIESSKKINNFNLRLIVNFLRKICDIYNLKYDSNKKYFSIEKVLSIPEVGYTTTLVNGTVNIGEIFKASVRKKNLKEI